jgi:chemotaxis protein CheD
MYSAEESHTHYSLQGLSSVNLVSGDHYVSTSENEVLVTILGSCISCCIRDPIAKVGGMNHFLLPSSTEKDVLICGKAARFGAYAMEVLINNLINKGAVKKKI